MVALKGRKEEGERESDREREEIEKEDGGRKGNSFHVPFVNC